MFSIGSNLKEVIAQTERLLVAIPEAMESAWRPELWIEEAKDVAARTMQALASGEEAKYIPDFVETVTAGLLPSGGLSLKAKNPRSAGMATLPEAQAARGALIPGMRGLFQEQVQNFEELLLEWVETEKRKDKRDWGKTDEEIADLISYILLSPTLGPKGEAARKKLAPHIEAFLAKRAAAGLSAEKASEWLRAVLAAWRELVRMKYAGKVRHELHELART